MSLIYFCSGSNPCRPGFLQPLAEDSDSGSQGPRSSVPAAHWQDSAGHEETRGQVSVPSTSNLCFLSILTIVFSLCYFLLSLLILILPQDEVWDPDPDRHQVHRGLLLEEGHWLILDWTQLIVNCCEIYRCLRQILVYTQLKHLSIQCFLCSTKYTLRIWWSKANIIFAEILIDFLSWGTLVLFLLFKVRLSLRFVQVFLISLCPSYCAPPILGD